MSFRNRNGRRLPKQTPEDGEWRDWEATGEPANRRGQSRNSQNAGPLPPWPDETSPSPADDRSSRARSDALYRPSPESTRPRRSTREATRERGSGRFPELTRSLRDPAQPRSSRPPRGSTRSAQPADEPWDQAETDLDWESPAEYASASRSTSTRARTREQTRRRPAYERPARPARSAPTLTMPQFMARAGIAQDRLLLGLLGIAIVSLALMAAIVGNRISTLPDTVVLHLNAAGVADLSGDRSNFWRLPLGITMLTLMNVVAAWFFIARDAFVSRLLLGATLLIHFLAWMAVFQLFW